MNSSIRFLTVVIGLLFFQYASAQNMEASLNTGSITTSDEKPTVTTQSAGKEVTITFKNFAEKPVAIFAGPKEGIRDPQIRTFGGLSKNNTLYLRENEVVCLMNVQKLPIACTKINPGVTTVEVNVSGNAIVSK